MTRLEARLRRLEDRAAIDDLVLRYFLAADGDDPHGIVASFTEDASFLSSGAVNASGRAAIVDFIAAARTAMGLTVHTLNYVLHGFDGEDEAHGLVGAHLELVLGGQSLYGAVRYQDCYRRTDEGWRISRRDMRTIHIAPWQEVGEALRSLTPQRWPGAPPAASDFARRPEQP